MSTTDLPSFTDTRGRSLAAALEYLATTLGDRAVRCIEIGCAFQESQGISTLQIANFASRHPDSRFVSIDIEADNIGRSRAILSRYAPQLADRVDYRQGASTEVLAAVLEALGTVDFAYLDGGGGPEVNLWEFLAVNERLSPSGAILVDDYAAMAPTPAYGLHRPLGKCTFIVPFLLHAEHASANGSALTAYTRHAHRFDYPPVRPWYVYRNAQLVYGPEGMLEHHQARTGVSGARAGG